METETLTFKSLKLFDIAWDITYFPLGYKLNSVKKKWNWGRFSYVYEVIIQRETPKQHVEIIDNKNDINTKKCIFSFTKRNGDFYKKEIYYDPKSDFDFAREFNKWVNDRIM
jgi:hypothetical protein